MRLCVFALGVSISAQGPWLGFVSLRKRILDELKRKYIRNQFCRLFRLNLGTWKWLTLCKWFFSFFGKIWFQNISQEFSLVRLVSIQAAVEKEGGQGGILPYFQICYLFEELIVGNIIYTRMTQYLWFEKKNTLASKPAR